MKTRIAVFTVGVVESVIAAVAGIAAVEHQNIYGLYICIVWVAASAVTIRNSLNAAV